MKSYEIAKRLDELKECEYIKILLDDGTTQVVEYYTIENIPEKECVFYKVGLGDRFDYVRIINILPNTGF